MATKTESTKKKRAEKDLRTTILEGYQEYLLMKGENPASVYAFCQNLNISESDFYQHFSDFESVASQFWIEIFEDSVKRLESSTEWEEFMVREKLLTFYYSFFEKIKGHRSYALLTLKGSLLGFKKEFADIKDLKADYKKWIKMLVAEGQAQGEIAGRSKLSDVYDDLFWYQFMFLLDFWRKDRSRGFEKTDEAIEKSVNLSFDLIEKNALDSAFDFGKFIFQNR